MGTIRQNKQKRKDRFIENLVFDHIVVLNSQGNKISYSQASYIEALKEYDKRIDIGCAFLGCTMYDIDENVSEYTYKHLNEWNSIGIVRNIDQGSGLVAADCIYPYDLRDFVITMICDTSEPDEDNNVNIVKINDCYLTRRYQKGISIIDGSSIMGYLKDLYPFEYNLELNGYTIFGDKTDGIIDSLKFEILLDKFKEKIGYRFGEFSKVCDENGSIVGIVTSIDRDPIDNAKKIVTFRTKEKRLDLDDKFLSAIIVIRHLADSYNNMHILALQLSSKFKETKKQ